MSEMDKDKYIGCGICVNLCLEETEMIGGKARIKNETTECLKYTANNCLRRALGSFTGDLNQYNILI